MYLKKGFIHSGAVRNRKSVRKSHARILVASWNGSTLLETAEIYGKEEASLDEGDGLDEKQTWNGFILFYPLHPGLILFEILTGTIF